MDIIAFCGAVISNLLFVKNYSEISDTIIRSSRIIFLDANLLKNQKNLAILGNNLNYFKKIIFIETIKTTSYLIPDNIKKSIKYILPFPCDIQRARNYYKKKLIENDDFDILIGIKDYDVDKENEKLKEVFIGDSRYIRVLRSEIIKASKNDRPVLLLGETGVGKTTAARLIHDFSSRRENPFITTAASDFHEGLIETALFGCSEGAFTGAKNSSGYFKMADNGTFFLDEIGLASYELQKKLLLVIESGSYYPLGGNSSINTDVRMIFATNEDLKQKIASGEFKSDLYFRIEHNIIRFPSLREYKEDIKSIAVRECGLFNKSISNEAVRKLEDYDWPGNGRQLKNYLKKACEMVNNDEIKAKDIRFEF